MSSLLCCSYFKTSSSSHRSFGRTTERLTSEDETRALYLRGDTITTQPYSASRVRRRFKFHKEKKQPTVVCCAPAHTMLPGQVDLFPRSWCHILPPKDTKVPKPWSGTTDAVDADADSDDSFSSDYEGVTVWNDQVVPAFVFAGRVVWRFCFFATCLPCCYGCFACRTWRMRKAERHKVRRPDMVSCRKGQHAHNGASNSDEEENPLLDKSRDAMSRTIFRQVSENKRMLSHKGRGSKRKGVNSGLEEEEDGEETTPVIDVNVILLHSNVSHMVQKHLSSRLPNTASTSAMSIVTLGGNLNSSSNTDDPMPTEPVSFLSVPTALQRRLQRSTMAGARGGATGVKRAWSDKRADTMRKKSVYERRRPISHQDQVLAERLGGGSLKRRNSKAFDGFEWRMVSSPMTPNTPDIDPSIGHDLEELLEREPTPDLVNAPPSSSSRFQYSNDTIAEEEEETDGGPLPFIDEEEDDVFLEADAEEADTDPDLIQEVDLPPVPPPASGFFSFILPNFGKGDHVNPSSGLSPVDEEETDHAKKQAELSPWGKIKSRLASVTGNKPPENDFADVAVRALKQHQQQQEEVPESDDEGIGVDLREDPFRGRRRRTRKNNMAAPTRRESFISAILPRRGSLLHPHHGPISAQKGSNLFYSFDANDSDAFSSSGDDNINSSDENDNGYDNGRNRMERVVAMNALGSRTELVKDLGYQLTFSVFDEASVSEWRGKDLRLANEIPNMDLLVIFVRKNDFAELRNILKTDSGMMAYISRFWKGFYPLLFVELQTDAKEPITPEEIKIRKDIQTKFDKEVTRLRSFFGDVHHIQAKESQLSRDIDWVTECMARLFIHSRLYQCSRFYGNGQLGEERCPGGCGLRGTRRRRRFARRKVLWKTGGGKDHNRDNYTRSKIII